MYLDFFVKIPDIKGKITRKPKGKSVYINYEYAREYNKKRKYNVPKRVIIGKVSKTDPAMMVPNQNYLTYFPEEELPEEKFNSVRSSCLRIGTHLVIKSILGEYGLPEILSNQFDSKELGLFEDLISYSLICEDNAGQYYPDYAYNHPLFTEKMHIYSDTKVSAFLNDITKDQSNGFLDDWNAASDKRQKIYVSYDATNKNSQAEGLELVEYGKAKIDTGDPIFNYTIAYDTHNSKPLFYEAYPGSIVDVSQLECTLGKIEGYKYRNIGLILDRGYFSKDNIKLLDAHKFDFILMVKGMSSLVNEMVLENKGSFEDRRECRIRRHHVYGKTIRRKLYADDEEERYFHLYHSTGKEHGEREQVEEKLEKWAEFLKEQYQTKYVISDKLLKYFDPFYDKNGVLATVREKSEVVERELKLCGYFVLVSSEKMTAAEALERYYSRDTSEKLFRGDKSYLGNKSARVHGNESLSAKIFVEFVALIVRNRIYKKLRDEAERIDGNPNYMTVPAAIKELEKIEMVRGLDRIYRMDHAVTKTQKTILNAFGMDVAYVKNKANEISEQLRKLDKAGGKTDGAADNG
jgi:transposase